MTLDDLDTAKKLAELRRTLLTKAARLDAEKPQASMLLGYSFDADVCDVLRRTLAGEFRRLASVAEARLRELGVVFPGDPVPAAKPAEPDVFIIKVHPIGAEMCVAEFERIRAACQAADDGYRVEA